MPRVRNVCLTPQSCPKCAAQKRKWVQGLSPCPPEAFLLLPEPSSIRQKPRQFGHEAIELVM
ncbi:hypothetical protein, partial [Sandarakinorhabdus sp.]|uniref:hypothetical protein n=1 Tax=Sandarakinorhabdus sp. TaxID=1916663 RepID=UPI003342195F